VVCVIGEGSIQYAVQAFWTATAYDVPLTVLVLRNEEYAILKWFAGLEQVEGAPGLDLPKLESAQLAAGYGVNTRRTEGVDDTREALREAIASGKPELVEIRVAPGMALF
jgi:benzoylformate decarboxylase